MESFYSIKEIQKCSYSSEEHIDDRSTEDEGMPEYIFFTAFLLHLLWMVLILASAVTQQAAINTERTAPLLIFALSHLIILLLRVRPQVWVRCFHVWTAMSRMVRQTPFFQKNG